MIWLEYSNRSNLVPKEPGTEQRVLSRLTSVTTGVHLTFIDVANITLSAKRNLAAIGRRMSCRVLRSKLTRSTPLLSLTQHNYLIHLFLASFLPTNGAPRVLLRKAIDCSFTI